MVYRTNRDLHRTADAVYINIRRENENKTLHLQTNKHNNCNWNIKNRYRSEFSRQFEGYIVSILLMHICVAKTKNGQIKSVKVLYL